MLFVQATPLWQYEAKVLAATAADSGSVRRAGKAGIAVPGKGTGNIAFAVDATSLGADVDADAECDNGQSRRRCGSLISGWLKHAARFCTIWMERTVWLTRGWYLSVPDVNCRLTLFKQTLGRKAMGSFLWEHC